MSINLKKFIIPLVILTISCCIIVFIFTLIFFNREKGSDFFIFSEMLMVLVLLTACIFITRYITNNLMNEVIKAEETARKAVHDKNILSDIKEAAEMSNRAKGFFLAQMSHEIRTPMNAILGISEIQLLNKNLPAEAEEGYKKIYESGNLLLNIINDILDFSKIDAGKLEIVCEKYDVPSLINDAVQLNRLRFEGKKISFKIILDENTPHELIGDELRIKQILFNLLSNAFKYTEAGEVELLVHSEEHSDKETSTLVLIVKDTGQGMTQEQISRIYEEYTRFNMNTNRGISGTGLGMSITKRLVDMMNGEIKIESKPGEGSVFTVRLPQARCGSAVCGEEIAKKMKDFSFKNSSLQKKSQIIHEHMPYGKVLVVDDVESNLLVAKGLLMPYGLNIETVKSGFEAIEKIKNDKNYDIVFMDHMMPKMDGLRTTQLLRDFGYTSPIVALTANAVVGQEEMFLANGFDGFISKPIDSRELNYILIELIRNKKLKKDSVPAENTQAENIPNDNEIVMAAVFDIKNAVSVLEEVMPKINSGDAVISDMELFITTVHGMKSALANINKKQLSAQALELENAGRNSEIKTIIAKVPNFIKELNSLLETAEQSVKYEKSNICSEDLKLLRDKFDEIKKASANLNLINVKTAINEIKQKTWTSDINKIISEINVYLIRGELSKIVVVLNEADELLSKKEKNGS